MEPKMEHSDSKQYTPEGIMIRKSRKLATTLIVFWAILLLPSFVIAFMSTFGYSVEITHSIVAMSLLYSILLAPFVLIVAIIGGVTCLFGHESTRKRKTRKFFVLLPFLNIATFTISYSVIDIARFFCGNLELLTNCGPIFSLPIKNFFTSGGDMFAPLSLIFLWAVLLGVVKFINRLL